MSIVKHVIQQLNLKKNLFVAICQFLSLTEKKRKINSSPMLGSKIMFQKLKAD